MLCLKTTPYLHRPISPLKSLIIPRRLSFFSPRHSSSSSSPAAAAMSTSAPVSTVEHVVIFKVRDSTDQSKIDSMVSNLQSLTSLGIATHLTAGPILRPRSAAAASAGFTHLLHSRYRFPSDLASYSSDPRHVAVVKEFVLPICDDIMAVDWTADLVGGPSSPQPGSALRITLAKPKEGKAKELMVAIEGMKESAAAKSAAQVSLGENFSPARAKGYEIGFLAVFDVAEALDRMETDGGLVEAEKEKVRPLLESIIVLDFVVPAPSPAAAVAATSL